MKAAVRILLALLCLLALATLASAEGVWVLWSESWLEDAKRLNPAHDATVILAHGIKP